MRKEISPEEEVVTKFDFYTQTVSTKTTYYLGGNAQIKPGQEGGIPFNKYSAPLHVLQRIRQDLIDMGGKPNPIRPTDSERARTAPVNKNGLGNMVDKNGNSDAKIGFHNPNVDRKSLRPKL